MTHHDQHEYRPIDTNECAVCGYGRLSEIHVLEHSAADYQQNEAEERRDRNATAAMQALIPLTWVRGGKPPASTGKWTAEHAYAIADAMEIARNKR